MRKKPKNKAKNPKSGSLRTVVKLRFYTLHDLPEEKIGCSVRNVTFNKIQITKKDGPPIPHMLTKN